MIEKLLWSMRNWHDKYYWAKKRFWYWWYGGVEDPHKKHPNLLLAFQKNSYGVPSEDVANISRFNLSVPIPLGYSDKAPHHTLDEICPEAFPEARYNKYGLSLIERESSVRDFLTIQDFKEATKNHQDRLKFKFYHKKGGHD